MTWIDCSDFIVRRLFKVDFALAGVAGFTVTFTVRLAIAVAAADFAINFLFSLRFHLFVFQPAIRALPPAACFIRFIRFIRRLCRVQERDQISSRSHFICGSELSICP